MKKKWSLRRFLREELESERGDLIFLLQISIPIAVVSAVVFAHYIMNKKLEANVASPLATSTFVSTPSAQGQSADSLRSEFQKNIPNIQFGQGKDHDVKNP